MRHNRETSKHLIRQKTERHLIFLFTGATVNRIYRLQNWSPSIIKSAAAQLIEYIQEAAVDFINYVEKKLYWLVSHREIAWQWFWQAFSLERSPLPSPNMVFV